MEKQAFPRLETLFGNPAILFRLERRPVALRLRLSTDLPLSEKMVYFIRIIGGFAESENRITRLVLWSL